MERTELVQFLVEVIRTPVGRVEPGSRLAQAYRVTKHGREVRMPDKLKAVAQLAQMCGWNAPVKHEVDAWSPLERIVRRVMELNAANRPAPVPASMVS